jgi:hypothetical protein
VTGSAFNGKSFGPKRRTEEGKVAMNRPVATSLSARCIESVETEGIITLK